MKRTASLPAVPPFLLQATIDQNIVIDEQLWTLDQLSERVSKMLPLSGFRLAWGFSDSDLWVTFRRQDGYEFADWKCSECGRPNGLYSAGGVNPSQVLRWMSTASCRFCAGSWDREFASAFEVVGDLGLSRTNAHLDSPADVNDSADLMTDEESGFDVDEDLDDDLANALDEVLSGDATVIVPSSEYFGLATQLDEADDVDEAVMAHGHA